MGELLTGTAALLGAVAAIILALGVIWLKFLKPTCKRFWRGLRMVQRVTQALDWMLPFFQSQMVNNGGTTFKDQMDRIDTYAKGQTLRLEEVARELRTGQSQAIEAAQKAHEAATNAAALVEARHGELQARLAVIERRLEPTGLPVEVTITDGPVEVTIADAAVPVKIVEDEKHG
jgi:hypothetical protein